jgi:uncharacterized protein
LPGKIEQDAKDKDQSSRVRPGDIIRSIYAPGSAACDIFMAHAVAVSRKAVAVARRVPHLNPDIRFIAEAAMLHDIGICFTDAPSIGCRGKYPYVCHGYLGRQLLEERGLNRHALVCERHVGTGLSAADIRFQNLPLPDRDMRPETIEEEIICYADKFFSKKTYNKPAVELPVTEVIRELEKYGPEPVRRFLDWVDRFGGKKILDEAVKKSDLLIS